MLLYISFHHCLQFEEVIEFLVFPLYVCLGIIAAKKVDSILYIASSNADHK